MPKLIEFRNWLNDFSYSKLFRPILFSMDPEFVHKAFVLIGRVLGSNLMTRKTVSLFFDYENRALEQKIGNLRFRNPVGLSAGFDKDAQLMGLMGSCGFGFAEAGSVTAKANSGNSGKRMRRIIREKAIWVNLGLNNKGADEIYSRIKGRRYEIPFGINIAKTNSKEAADSDIGLKDYLYSVEKFRDVGDYLVLNISCPNAFGGQPFSKTDLYESLLKGVDKLKIEKQVFVKLSPDLSKENLDKILNISKKHKIQGFICSNLTKNGLKGSGGFSGKMVEKKSEKLLRYVYKKTKGKYVLIGVGGVFSAEDAYRKIRSGANLVQLFTGMIYRGPGLMSEINYGLVKLLKRDGFSNISEAVGADLLN